jgi:hypothetical protein
VEGKVFCFGYRLEARRSAQSGPATLAVGRLALESQVTRESLDALYCVLHFGAADFRCGLVAFPGPDAHEEIEAALFEKFQTVSFHRVLRALDRTFPGHDYALRDLFLDERRRVAEVLLEGTMRRYEDDYLEIFEDNRRLMEFLREIDSPIPGPLRVAADVTLTNRLLAVTGGALSGEERLDDAEDVLRETVDLARRLGAHLHISALRKDVEELVRRRVASLVKGQAAAVRAAGELVGTIDLAARLGLWLDLWEAQNRFWTWAGSPGVTLDRESTAALARRLWFDEATLLARAGFETEARAVEG